MTPALVSSTPTGSTPLARIHAGLDELGRWDLARVSAAGFSELLTEITRAEARLESAKLAVLAAAHRAQAAAASGAASTGQWAARIANTDQAVAHRQVGIATDLADRVLTRDALADGAISVEHAAIIVRANRDLPARVTQQERTTIEAALVSQAQVLAPGALRKAARRALAAIEPDRVVVDAHEDALVTSEEDRARAKTRLSLHENSDGTVTGHFTVPALHGQLLTKIIETITAPTRGRLGAAAAQVGDREERTDWDRARGLALCELIEHLPTDHLHPKTAATLLVKVDQATLAGALKVAGLDTGGDLSAREARRLACGAGLIPTVLNGASQVLDLGRSARLFSEPQRVALGLTHQHCAADGCERPFSWCELHHRKTWASGGTTNLADAVPLCPFHHQRIHDPAYHHIEKPDGGITFHRKAG